MRRSNDAMCDAKWSTTNPCLFATSDVNGKVAIYDLSKKIEGGALVGGEKIDFGELREGEKTASSGGAVSKVSWSNDGRRLAVCRGNILYVNALIEGVVGYGAGDEKSMLDILGSSNGINKDKEARIDFDY